MTLPVREMSETVASPIPLRLTTGLVLPRHKGVTMASLAEPGYGRMLAGKLVAIAVVMLAAGPPGRAISAGRRTLARALAVSSLAESFVVVFLATALPVTSAPIILHGKFVIN